MTSAFFPTRSGDEPSKKKLANYNAEYDDEEESEVERHHSQHSRIDQFRSSKAKSLHIQ